MSMQDTIADMLTRIRNALRARHGKVQMPCSKIKAAIAEVLKSEGYIADYEVVPDNKQGMLLITLKYHKGQAVIQGLARVSKPSCRVYVGFDDIPKVRNGLGINILSTPKGVVSDRLARQSRVGGEILCAVW